MNDELKVGEIGVLQNLTRSYWLNGITVDVVGGLEYRTGTEPNGLLETHLSYRVKYPIPNWSNHYSGYVKPHQIRRITDPDAQQSTEEEKELHNV